MHLAGMTEDGEPVPDQQVIIDYIEAAI